MHDVHLKLDGPRGTITIGGQDVSKGVRGVTLSHTVTEAAPRLVLDVVAEPVEVEGKTHVHIPAATAALLVDLGWTPPDDGQPVDLTDPSRHDQIITIIRREAHRDPGWLRTLLRREDRIRS